MNRLLELLAPALLAICLLLPGCSETIPSPPVRLEIEHLWWWVAPEHQPERFAELDAEDSCVSAELTLQAGAGVTPPAVPVFRIHCNLAVDLCWKREVGVVKECSPFSVWIGHHP